ncbi:MAG: ABC transporter ATP-binding protein [Vulcanimicrobiaceae bacterium]
MTLANPAIAIDGLYKRYGELTAVDGISLRVEAGDFFGFLGPNGAGKTTTIGAIVGLLRKTAGSIQIFGYDIDRQWRVARRLVGLAPQEFNFDRYLSIRDVLLFQAGYFGLRPRVVCRRVDELLERFDLTAKAHVEYTKISGGQKRRLMLARALIHEPKLLILDEPTAGVDVELRLELWEMLRVLNAQGITIFLTTHYLEEAEALCRNIAIVRGGKIVAQQSTQGLLDGHRETTLAVRLDRPIRELPATPVLRGARFEVGDTLVQVDGLTASQVASALAALEAAGFIVEAVDFKRATLQDVFLELTRS